MGDDQVTFFNKYVKSVTSLFLTRAKKINYFKDDTYFLILKIYFLYFRIFCKIKREYLIVDIFLDITLKAFMVRDIFFKENYMNKILVSLLSVSASLALSATANAASSHHSKHHTKWVYSPNYTVSVDPYWDSATVYYYTDTHDVWTYTVPCASMSNGYQCAGVTYWGAPVVWSYYDSYTTFSVHDVVYTCDTYFCY